MFENGRIEAFMTATTLTPKDMADPHYVPRIARKLRCDLTLPTSHTHVHLRKHAAQRLALDVAQGVAGHKEVYGGWAQGDEDSCCMR